MDPSENEILDTCVPRTVEVLVTHIIRAIVEIKKYCLFNVAMGRFQVGRRALFSISGDEKHFWNAQ